MTISEWRQAHLTAAGIRRSAVQSGKATTPSLVDLALINSSAVVARILLMHAAMQMAATWTAVSATTHYMAAKAAIPGTAAAAVTVSMATAAATTCLAMIMRIGST